MTRAEISAISNRVVKKELTSIEAFALLPGTEFVLYGLKALQAILPKGLALGVADLLISTFLVGWMQCEQNVKNQSLN